MDAIDFEWAEVVPRTKVANEPLARIICESSQQNRRDNRRDGSAEPHVREAYLKQYVDRLSNERSPAGLAVTAVVVEVFVKNAGGELSSRWEDHAGREVRVPWLQQLPVSGTSHRAWRRCSQDGIVPFAL